MDKRTPNGNRTYTAGTAILKGQPVKFSSGKVVPCTAANDAAIGIALDSAAADGDIIPVAILGNFTGTVEVRVAGAVEVGAQIAADGTATAAATDVIIGRALEAGASEGDMVEIAHQVGQVK